MHRAGCLHGVNYERNDGKRFRLKMGRRRRSSLEKAPEIDLPEGFHQECQVSVLFTISSGKDVPIPIRLFKQGVHQAACTLLHTGATNRCKIIQLMSCSNTYARVVVQLHCRWQSDCVHAGARLLEVGPDRRVEYNTSFRPMGTG